MFVRRLLSITAVLCLKSMSLAGVSTPSSNIKVIHKTCKSMDITWHRGDGQLCMVTCRKASDQVAEPADGWYYLEDSRYGYGSDIGNANYCVFIGIDSFVSIKNLDENTAYIFEIFEFDYNPYIYLRSGVPALIDSTHSFSATVQNQVLDSCKNRNRVRLQAVTKSSFSLEEFEWNFGEDTFYGDQTIAHLGLAGTNNFTLKVKPAMGCIQQTQKGSLYIIPGAENGFIKSDTAICTYEKEFFTSQIYFAPVPKTAFIQTWFFDNGTKMTTIGGHRNHQIPGEYSLKLIVYSLFENKHSGCSDTFSFAYKVIQGTTLELGPDTCYKKGDLLILRSPVEAVSYIWNHKVPGKGYIISDTGVHFLTIRDAKGCNAEDSIRVRYCASVSADDFTHKNLVSIYSSNGLLHLDNADRIAHHFRIYSASGALLSRWYLSPESREDVEFNNGVYLVQIDDGRALKVIVGD